MKLSETITISWHVKDILSNLLWGVLVVHWACFSAVLWGVVVIGGLVDVLGMIWKYVGDGSRGVGEVLTDF